MHSPAFLRRLFEQAHLQKMNSVNKQQQPGTCGGTAPNEQQNSSKNGPTPPVVGSTGLFLNVAHLMVRQSSDTTNNRLTRPLTRTSAFDHAAKQTHDEEQRPATSQCVDDEVPEMPHHSPYLRRPTRLTKKVTRTTTAEKPISMDHGDAETGSFIRLNQYRLIEEIGQAMKVLDKLKLVKNFACFRPPPIRKKSGKQNKSVIDGGLSVHRNPLQLVQREIAILKKLSHPNIVKLVEVLDDPSDNYLYMVFEYVERRSLLELPTDNPLEENVTLGYFRDTLKGLEYLHYQKIVHRDLKPSNLLHTETESVKIADFGVSCEFEGIDAFLTGTAGTPAFMAPEALTENSSQFYSGRAQDLWSLGVTLYSLVFGNVPFWDPYVIALHRKIKNDPLRFPEHIQISDHLKGLIQGMLQKDPGLRLMLHEIKEHPWVTLCGKMPMPSEPDNCTLVTVTEDEIRNCVRVIPRLDTLILVKAMGRKKHFGNPFRNQSPQRRKSSSLRQHFTPPATPTSLSEQQLNVPPPSARPFSSSPTKEPHHNLETRLNAQFDALSLKSQCNGTLFSSATLSASEAERKEKKTTIGEHRESR